MLDKFRMNALKACIATAWWLARPRIGKWKILQHWEIATELQTEQITQRDPRLLRVRRASLYVAGEMVLNHNIDQGLAEMVNELVDEIENGQEWQGEKQ